MPFPPRRLIRGSIRLPVLGLALAAAAGVMTVSAAAPPPTTGHGETGLHDSMMPSTSPDAGIDGGLAPAAATSTLAATALPTGVDTSHYQHQHGSSTIDWGAVAASGQKFAIMKATELYTDNSGQQVLQIDPYFHSDLTAAHAAGLVVGAYAMGHPELDPIVQADDFASTIGPLPSYGLPPVLDLELSGGQSTAQIVAWTHAFLNRLTADTGTVPMIYSGPGFWGDPSHGMGGSTEFTGYPLWEAHYTSAAAPYSMGGWPTYTFWQWTSTATIAGITGNVDQDRFNTATGANLANLHAPVGSVDVAQEDATGTLTVSGWAFDPDASTSTEAVHVYIDGQLAQAVAANQTRTDIGNAFPYAGSQHGYTFTGPVGSGSHTVCVYAIDTTYANQHTTLGCRTVSPNLPLGRLDTAGIDSTGNLTVAGWALDPDALTTSGTVHVYIDGKFSQAVTADQTRTDIGAAFAGAGDLHGYTATAAVGSGSHTVCTYAIDTTYADMHTDLGCRTVAPAVPVGSLDTATTAGSGTLTVSGWAYDPDTPTSAETVHVYIDGAFSQAVTADGSRPDVGAAIPGIGNQHGYTATAAVAAGRHTVCTYAIDTTYADMHTDLGCRTVTTVPTLPSGSFDSATVDGTGTLTVSGWAYDPDTPTSAETVHVYVDGQFFQAVSANGSRPDVGAAIPGIGNQHGFTVTGPIGTGRHTVCAYAIDTTYAGLHTDLGCRTVTTVPTLPIGAFDSAAIDGTGTLTVSGWAFDPDTPTTAGTVQVLVDGQLSQTVTADQTRPDIGALFPAAGSQHGYTATASVGPGSHSVCVRAVDTSFSNLRTDMGCRTVSP